MATINQTEIFEDTTTHRLYEILMDAKHHAAFTGDDANIRDEVGGTFSTYGGYSTGKNKELLPGKRIVQTWRAADWPEGVESNVTFDFEQHGDNAIIHFTQTNVPDEQSESIANGWHEYYWEPMRGYLAVS